MQKTKINLSKILALLLLSVAIVGAAFMLSACGDDETTTNNIAGTYTCEKADVTATSPAPWMQTAADASTLTLVENMTGTFSFNGTDTDFTYSRVGNHVTISCLFGGITKIWNGVLNDNKITFEHMELNASLKLNITYKK